MGRVESSRSSPPNGRTVAGVAVAVLLGLLAVVSGLAAPATADPPTPAPTPTERFVIALYTDFLGRPPTDVERTSTAQQIDSGVLTRPEAAVGVSRTYEFAAEVVNRFYRTMLGRDGEPTGVDYWVNEIRSGHRTEAQVAGQILASDEFFDGAGGGTVNGFVTALYTRVLGRAPDPDGLNYWVQRAASYGRYDVAASFYQTPEALYGRVSVLYESLLGRLPDPGGAQYWAGRLAAEGDIAVAAALAGSPEYYDRAQSSPI